MRKTSTVTISAEGSRDKGNTYVITEMPAAMAEDWAWRAIGVVSRAGMTMPDDADQAGGMLVIAALGFQTFLKGPWDEVKPLLNEMFECVQIKRGEMTQRMVAEDVEEVSTRTLLRDEVWKIHTGFSLASVLSILRQEAKGEDPSLIKTPADLSEVSSADE